MKRSFAMWTCCCLGLVLASCSATPEVTDAGKKILEPVSCIAVLPARVGSDEEVAKIGGYFENVRKGADYVNSVMVQDLMENPKARIVSASQLESEVIGNLVSTIDQASKTTNCDAVLVTTVLKFKQRQGTTYAADEPASAAFDMRLYKVDNKNVIWAADFSETQQPLLSNLFTFGKAQSRGFQWITVEELVSEGLKERIAACPYL